MEQNLPPDSPYRSPESPGSAFPPSPPRTSGFAISSLVTGILGMGIVPVVLGHVALSKIKKAMGTLQGRGLAIAGLVLGYVQIAAYVLLIIPILFIGAGAWKKGSDRAGCILNQRNVQQAVRSYEAKHGLKPGDPIDWQEIVGPGKLLEKEPTCPGQGEYEFASQIPATGTAVVECSKTGTDKHAPNDLSGW
jgi:hypothetical protein